MHTKIIALIVQSYLIFRGLTPPTKYATFKQIIETEGLLGVILQFGLTFTTIAFNLIQSLIYVFIMQQQEIGLIPILNDIKFSEWNLLEILCFLTTIGGCSLRLWCYKCLKEFFTYDVTIKENHKLITTGPYSVLAHPSYTGAFMMFVNVVFLWYQLHPYVSVYASGSMEILLNLGYCFIIFQQITFILAFFGRVSYEEGVLKKKFGKDWDVYFSQRKRYIPYII